MVNYSLSESISVTTLGTGTPILNPHRASQSILVEANLKGFTKDFSRVTFPQGSTIGEIVEMRIKSRRNNELYGLPIA